MNKKFLFALLGIGALWYATRPKMTAQTLPDNPQALPPPPPSLNSAILAQIGCAESDILPRINTPIANAGACVIKYVQTLLKNRNANVNVNGAFDAQTMTETNRIYGAGASGQNLLFLMQKDNNLAFSGRF